MTENDTISFVIRAYNEEACLGMLFDMIYSQSGIEIDREVVVVDSGSTDRTVEIAKSRNTVLIEIPKAEFDYSKAINLGIENSRGSWIVIISAHAIPCDTEWLRRLVYHFRDRRVAGVFCRQVPWPDAYWREVLRLERAFGQESRVYDGERGGEPEVPFSNAASCIRRSVWEQHDFRLPWAEDLEWANWAVANGHKIVYDGRACVFHSHNESPRQLARRIILLEKTADMTKGRTRNVFVTLKQAAGYAARDVSEILRLKHAKANRVKYIWESLLRSFWFLRDFRQRTKC